MHVRDDEAGCYPIQSSCQSADNQDLTEGIMHAMKLVCVCVCAFVGHPAVYQRHHLPVYWWQAFSAGAVHTQQARKGHGSPSKTLNTFGYSKKTVNKGCSRLGSWREGG